MNIFDVMYKPFKIDKPIRIIELFGGYGSQSLSLKYLGVKFEHWKLCEWAIKSIQAYKDIHYPDDFIEVLDLSKDDIIDYLYKKGISQNYNEPMTLEQIKRLSDEKLYTIYENIIVTNNLVNIQQVKGEDLEIVDTDKYCYIMTYSFPCQDLSLAGKGKGMSDTSTRSGMLWEVERILSECKNKPQVLIMENVIQVHSEDNLPDFNKWKYRLEELGYKNYFQDLIATDYGIPQIRNRCFMVSILGDYSYTFPKPIPLKLKLKDILEENVGGKYNISKELLEHINNTKKEHKEYTQYDRYNGEFEQLCRIWKNKAPTLHTNCNKIKIYTCLDLCQMGREGRTREYVNYFPTLSARDYKSPKLIKETNGKETTIRKLTPKECFRLMGVKDEDFERCAKNQSDSSLYHLAGDSIVVNVLMAIFKEML